MANNSPTIVAASLSDDQLKKSIDSLVTHVDEAMKKMVQSTNNAVGEMEAKLKSLGNLKIDSGGSADGGASKRTKSQNAETDAVEKNIAARDKQIKKNQEAAMSFDQIAAALSKARQTVSEFNTRRASGILPSSEDYKRYEQALARIVEFNDKLKQSALSRADANQWANAFDGKGLVKDFFSVDERLKQLNQYYKEEEKSSQKATAAIKENTQAKKENASVDQPAKSARDSYIAFMQGYKQQAEQIRRLMEEEQKAMQQRRQGVVDGFTKTIEERKARIKELSEEVAKLYKERPDDYRDTIKQRTEEMNALKQKIRELTEAQKTLADSPIGASNRYLELEKEYNRIKNIMIDTTNVQRQSTQETEKQAQGAKEYSEQVKRIAAEIRESAQWQKSDKFGFKRGMMNLDGRAYPVTENLDMGLRLEDQIVSILQKANDERQRGVQITQQQAQSSRQVSEEDRKAMEALGWADSQQKKKYMPPMMNVERISEARGALQSITGMQEAWVDSINKTKSSYYQLSDYVKQLKNELIHLPKGVHDEAAKVLIREIQQAEREMQKFQQTMSRPVSLKDALSGSEKTLDDIAYKMQRLRAYKQGIDLTKPNATNEIKQVDEALAKLQKDADKWMSKSQEMIKSNTALGRSWNYMKNRLAFYFTVGASTQFVKNLIEVRSQYEMNERALGILINSAERGTQIFNELSSMALVSPYTLIELSSAAKQLTAYDVAAKDVVDTTRRLADMAAAVGIPIERLTYALGQIKAYGYLNSRDARMFANAGIPLVKQLSDYYTELEGRLVSTADVYDRIKKKAIDYNEVMEVINKMTDQGGKFFDFQAKMADTLKVRLANLTLAWNNMLNDMGKESQGVLTFGIGALRDLFLQWKQLDNLIKDMALAVGVRTLLVAIRAATIGLTSFGRAATWNAILGKKLGGVVVGLAKSFGTLFSSRLTWFALLAMAAVEATQAIFGVNEAQKALNESIRNSAKDNYDNISKFIEQYKEVRDSLYKTVKKQVPDGMVMVTERTDSQGNKWHSISKEYTETLPQDIDENEAKKAWEAVREQIELTVASSDKYIGNLLSISNMSERVRQGFNLLDDVQIVNAALKELDDDTIKVSKDLSAWWNAWQAPDGLIGNLKDYQETLNDIIAKYGTLESFRENTFLGGKGSDDLNDYQTALERFRDDLQKTTDSILNFIELKGWSGDEGKINQVFEQITQKIVLDSQLDPQKAFTLQTEVEEARSKAAKQALLQRINDEKAALKIANDESIREALAADIERYNSWNETNGRTKVEWERFTKWLKEQHISETTAMFRNMDAEDIKSLNFQEGKHAEWVTRMVTQYAKEHKMSYDEAFKYLKSWVRNANQWSIFIPLTISTEDKKSVYDQLGEYDKAVDEADAQIERLTKRINELNAKKKKSKEETQELANAEQELADAQKAKADAEAKGGHGKKEKKDERAANKAAKQAESELQKALKDELSTIDKVRSIYKDLTKEGMSHANAVERATKGWDETVNAINRVLQKNGLQKLDLSKFAGIENPRELVNMLQSQLNTLLKRGAKPAEIKELQTKIQTLNVDAEKYDLTKITKGLNNELGKLKDEYELAVELDANPEMGNMFAEMFGIDTSAFPRTINEFMQMAQQEFEDVRKKLNLSESINIFTANSEQWYKWGEAVGYSKEQVDDFKKSFDGSVGVAKKWAQDIVKQTQDLQYKLADKNGKIAIEEEKLANLRVRLANEVNDEQGRLLELQIQDQQNTINKLKEEILQLLPTYNRLFGEVAEHSAAMTRKLARDYKNMLVDAQKRGKNPDGTYTVIDPVNGKSASVTEERLGKEIKNANKELGKTDNIFKKIKESLTKGEDKIVDWVGGIENIGEAIGQVGDLVDTIGNVYDMFGNPNEYDATSEALHDIATSMQGVNTAAKGIGQIASGDYIGGAMSVISGLSSAIGTWFDNGDKEILQQIKDSERAVKRLELAYIDLEHAVQQAYGMATIGAQKAAIANKELQLVELKRQLALERSRDSKDRDEDRIVELQKQIKELEYDIKDSTDAIVNDLLGISSVGDALEGVMSNIIDTFRNGRYKLKDIMKDVKVSFNDMIANMVMKMYTTKILEPWFEEQWNAIQNDIEKRMPQREITKLNGLFFESEQGTLSEWIANEKDLLERVKSGQYDAFYDRDAFDRGEQIEISREEWIKQTEEVIKEAEKELYSSMTPTKEDILHYAELLRNGQPIVEENLKDIESFLRELGLLNDKKQTSLSALQQGLQSMSEDTGSALESYMNGVSQQVYLHSDLLTQIRDAVVGMDMDVQVATQAQMLLQLQQSYAVQMAIQGILEGWATPSGQAVRVELVS